jgi:hydroxyacylglutathione hydrolase
MKLNEHLYFYPEGGMLDCNTFLIKDDMAIIIDVGLTENLPSLLKALEEDGIDPQKIDMITNTHLHMDHTWANEAFKEKCSARIEIVPIQKEYYDVSVRQTAQFFGMEPVDFQEDGLLDSTIALNTLTIEILPTPGHSPESVCFYSHQSKFLICGDLIFDGNTGRSDLPGGSGEQLKQSIENVAEREIDLLLPGHMGVITENQKVKKNFEFVRNNVFQCL